MAIDNDTDDMAGASVTYVDRRLVGASAVLVTGGLVVCLLGATMGAVAVVGACRRYIARLDESPRRMARRRLSQVRSATAAGIGAWQEYDRPSRLERAR